MCMAAEDIAQQRAVPPHDPAAEQAVLGGILIDNTAFDRIPLKPEDFYDRQHVLIFRTMQRIAAQGKALDYVTVYDALEAGPERPDASYLAGLADATPSAANIADHARIVKDKAGRRTLIEEATRLVSRAHNGVPTHALLEDFQGCFDALTEQIEVDDFEVFTLAELKHRPQEAVECVVDGLLKRGGLSILAGDTKAGKSLTARTLAWAVATGHLWLGRKTAPGPVLYLALEEDQDDVAAHLWQMGLTETDPVKVVYERPQVGAVPKLKRLVTQHQPVLMIVDTIIHLTDFDKVDDYGEVTRKLKPILDLARTSRAHIMLIHHTRKSGGEYGQDTLGSTAFRGITDTTFILKREGATGRSITSHGRGRWAHHIEEPLMLLLDQKTGRITPGGTKAEAVQRDKELALRDHLLAVGEKKGREDLFSAVPGDRGPLYAALKSAVTKGLIQKGKDGRKHVYWVDETNLSGCLPSIVSDRQTSSEVVWFGDEHGNRTPRE